MKWLILFVLLMFVFCGCSAERTKDGYEEIITNIETVTNPFLFETNIAETITEFVIEITTLIEKTQTNREVEQTTHTTEPTMPATISDMVGIINNYRKSNNLTSLKLSDKLCEIAEIRAEEASISWSHTRPNGLGIDSLLNDSDIAWKIIGENLAKCENATPQEIIDAWMNSKIHRENLLNSRYKYCGIAEYQNSEIRYISIILSDWARRKILCKRFSTKSRISRYQCA